MLIIKLNDLLRVRRFIQLPDASTVPALSALGGWETGAGSSRKADAAAPHFSDSSLEWAADAYALAFGGFRLLGGRSGGLQGRRRVFIAGIVLFWLGSLPGSAPDAASLRRPSGMAGVLSFRSAVPAALKGVPVGHSGGSAGGS